MNEIVKHHNDFNKLSLGNFSELEQNLLFGILTNCQNKSIVDIEIQADDLKRFVDRTNVTQEQLFKLVDDLATNFFKLDFTRIKECPDGSKEKEIYNLFSRFTIKYYGKNDKDPNARLEKIILRVNSDFAYLINEFTGDFTQFELDEFLYLRGKYTKILYRLLKEFRDKGYYIKKWQDFKDLMGIPESMSTSMIEKQILKPSVEKLSETIKTHLFDARIPFENLSYKLKKESSKRGKPQVTHIEFHFKPQEASCLDERQKYKNEQKAKKPLIEPNEPKYITELKELCAKRKKYKVGDEIRELIKVVKNSNGDYELYYKRNNETLVTPLTYEIAQNYLQAPKEQK